MKLSLSVRIGEAPGSKEKTIRTLDQIVDLASKTGYQAVCMRASQVGVHSPLNAITAARKAVLARQMAVSMITGDFPTPINNDAAPDALRNITPYLDLATLLHSDLIRIGMKTEADIAWAQRAADEARERGIRLAHQSHTQSLFETVNESVQTLKRVGRPNFGIIYEAANLDACGEPYGPDTLNRFQPYLFNVYLQNHRIKPDGISSVLTWKRGLVRFDPIRLQDSRGIDYLMVLEVLDRLGYAGYLTVHQAFTEIMEPEDAARESYNYLVSAGNFFER